MKKFGIILGLGFALSGCVSDKNLNNYICTHQIAIRVSAMQALKAADLIKDPVAREAAIEAANTTLGLLDLCPPVG